MSFWDRPNSQVWLFNSAGYSSHLEAFGVKVAAGEKPRAERIFEKVKKQIEGQYLSVGIFTKRDKISAKEEWAGRGRKRNPLTRIDTLSGVRHHSPAYFQNDGGADP